MKRNANIVALGIAAFVAGAGLTASIMPASAVGGPTVPAAPAAAGAVIVEVLHEKTNKPLAEMPVYITPGEGAAFVLGGITGDDGTVAFKDLDDGDYLATVFFNNHFASVKFFVLSGPDAPTRVTIYFNPDID